MFFFLFLFLTLFLVRTEYGAGEWGTGLAVEGAFLFRRPYHLQHFEHLHHILVSEKFYCGLVFLSSSVYQNNNGLFCLLSASNPVATKWILVM
jgi:hypothetical protein